MNRLSQEIELKQPIISIGSAGCLNTTEPNANTIYLIIGKEDVHHYAGAISFYNQAKAYKCFKIELIEHDGGHIVPETALKQLIHTLNQSIEGEQ